MEWIVQRRKTRGEAAGFTLVELMVVVAIVAILAAVALPWYTRYVQRSNVVEGTQALTQYWVQMEQYYQDNHAYGPTGGSVCGITAPGLVNFTLTCGTTNGGQTYVAKTTAAATSNINGTVYTIDQGNAQITLGIPSTWGALPAAAATSWVTKP